ncbi:MAG: preprotein translocase subunit SecG [Clostridia bacterium]|nr:preprotein translocase subunit SecG [Clostridia bacterium]
MAVSFEVYQALSLACVIAAFLCAIVVVVAVLIQPSNSSGISALGGQADTFYNKSKGKTLASTMKKVTYICMGLIALFMIGFYVVANFVQVA